MPSTFFGLDIGKTGLYMAHSGINTTAHNIANIETEGYTRQIIELKAGTPLRAFGRYGMIGTGVDVVSVTQTRSLYFDDKYRKNNSLYGTYSTRQNYMLQIQSYLNEIQLKGFTTTFDSLYDNIQELFKDPANLTVRTQVSNVAQSFCDYFNALYENMARVQEDCNFEIKNEIDRVNAYAQEIASLTKSINTIEIGGSNANDLRDQRNLIIDKLSAIVNVTVDERPVGTVGLKEYIVKIDGQTLVDTYDTNTLSVVPRETLLNQTDVEGLYNIVWSNGQQFNPYAATQSGSIKALFEIRDGNNKDNLQGVTSCTPGDTKVTLTKTNVNSEAKLNIPPEGTLTIGHREYAYSGFKVTIDPKSGAYTYEFELEEPVAIRETNQIASVGATVDYKGVPYYMAQMNEFIRTYAMRFNELHRQGVDLNGNAGMDFFTGVNKVTNEDFRFAPLPGETDPNYDEWSFTSESGSYVSNGYSSYYMITAQNFSVNDEIYHDARLFAAASKIVDGVGNYDIAEKLLALKTDTSMFRQGKPAAFLQTLVAEVGIDTKATENMSESQRNLVQSVSYQRLSVAGVDSEEEGMHLIQYRQAYNLSARVISVMNEIYDKLINYMGV